MTYRRRQRMEAFKRATFAALMSDALPEGQQPDGADAALGQDSSSTTKSEAWQSSMYASVSVH